MSNHLTHGLICMLALHAKILKIYKQLLVPKWNDQYHNLKTACKIFSSKEYKCGYVETFTHKRPPVV